MSTCPTNPEATVDDQGFCTAHGNDCADYALSQREEQTVTAYLSDGRHIDVPQSAAQDWAREAAELDTTLGLGDWYTDQGDEHQEGIQGSANDDPRCEHRDADLSVRVVNVSQVEKFNPELPLASTRVCDTRACILDAMAWVERTTGEEALWIGSDGFPHAALPSVHRVPILPTMTGDGAVVEESIESLNPEPTMAQYARLGRVTAAYLGANSDYNGGDICMEIANFVDEGLNTEAEPFPSIGGQGPEEFKFWRVIADQLGIEHDDDDDEEDGDEDSDPEV